MHCLKDLAAKLFPPSVQTDVLDRIELPKARDPHALSIRKDLGPNQIKWLEERFRFYGVFRQQALAEVGTAPTANLPSR